MHSPFMVCVVQAAPVYLDLERSVDKALALIEQAADNGAKFIAFPELWLPGYPWWVWLDGIEWAHQKGLSRRYLEQALDFEGAQAGRIDRAAADHRIQVLMGAAEREGERLYIAQWLVDETGRTLLRRRKLKPGPLELKVFGEGGAQDLPVADTALGRVGALACAEHRHPLLKHAMHLQHEMLHVAAWPSFALTQAPGMLSADTFLAISRTYAVEGGCYVLAPCAPLPAEVVALLCDTPDKTQRLHAGGGHAQVFAPDGEPLCTPLAPMQEGLLFAQVDPQTVTRARNAFDLSGHSSRSDVVRLQGPADLGKPSPSAGVR